MITSRSVSVTQNTRARDMLRERGKGDRAVVLREGVTTFGR
jgi:hypothetical protein